MSNKCLKIHIFADYIYLQQFKFQYVIVTNKQGYNFSYKQKTNLTKNTSVQYKQNDIALFF